MFKLAARDERRAALADAQAREAHRSTTILEEQLLAAQQQLAASALQVKMATRQVGRGGEGQVREG